MHEDKSNLLFLTSHLPYPPSSGGRLREFELIKGLSKFYNIFLIAITNTYDDDKKNIIALKQYCKDIQLYTSDATMSLEFLNYPPKILRIISSKVKDYINNTLLTKNISIIHLEGFYMYYYFYNKIRTVPIVIAEQNIEFELISQKIHITDGGDITDLKAEHDLTKKYEVLAWQEVDYCIALTDYDYNIIAQHIDSKKVRLISNGFDHKNLFQDIPINANCITNAIGEQSILITGNYSYYPNEDGALYFIAKIFPSIIDLVPNVKLYIVGNQPTKQMLSLCSEEIIITGKVQDIGYYISNTTIFVCPLRLGGGIKVKILEALTYNAAIISSPIGMQGISPTEPPSFLVANNDKEFISRILSLLNESDNRAALQRATPLALRNFFTWAATIDKMNIFFQYIIKESKAKK